MGAFLSHLAKALLIITLLARAGAVQPIPDSPAAAATGPPVQPPAAGGPPVPSPAPDVPADAPEAAPAPPGEPPGHGAEPHAGSVSPDPIYRLPTEARQVVLTIDDGPSGLTGQFLEVLAAEDVPAVFFWVTGSRQLPLAAEVIGQGHQLGTHTVSHPRLPQLPPEEAAAQIVHSKAALEDAAGPPSASSARRTASTTGRSATPQPGTGWPPCCGTWTRGTGPWPRRPTRSSPT